MPTNGKTIHALVRQHPFFATMEEEYLEAICKGAKIAEFKPGEIIFKTGEPANRFYLVQAGKISLEARTPSGRNVPVEKVVSGGTIGWSWLVPPFSWRLHARALEPTKVISLDGGHLLVACEENYKFGYILMRRVVQLMAHRLESIRQRVIEMCESNVSEKDDPVLAHWIVRRKSG